MRFVNIKLKLGNMRKEQEFTLYPLTRESRTVHIQSNQRWATIDLETGKGRINANGKQYATSWTMAADPLFIQLTADQLAELRSKCEIMIGNTNSDGTFTVIGGN